MKNRLLNLLLLFGVTVHSVHEKNMSEGNLDFAEEDGLSSSATENSSFVLIDTSEDSEWTAEKAYDDYREEKKLKKEDRFIDDFNDEFEDSPKNSTNSNNGKIDKGKKTDTSEEKINKNKIINEQILPILGSDFLKLLDGEYIYFGDQHFVDTYNTISFDLAFCHKMLVDVKAVLVQNETLLKKHKARMKKIIKALKEKKHESTARVLQDIDAIDSRVKELRDRFESYSKRINNEIANAESKHNIKLNEEERRIGSFKAGIEKYARQIAREMKNQNEIIDQQNIRAKRAREALTKANLAYEDAKNKLDAYSTSSSQTGNIDTKTQQELQNRVQRTQENRDKKDQLSKETNVNSETLKEKAREKHDYLDKVCKIEVEKMTAELAVMSKKSEEICDQSARKKEAEIAKFMEDLSKSNVELDSKIAELKESKNSRKETLKEKKRNLLQQKYGVSFKDIDNLEEKILSLNRILNDLNHKILKETAAQKLCKNIMDYRNNEFSTALNKYRLNPKIRTRRKAARSVYSLIVRLHILNKYLYVSGLICQKDYDYYTGNIKDYNNYLREFLLLKNKNWGQRVLGEVKDTLLFWKMNERPEGMEDYKGIGFGKKGTFEFVAEAEDFFLGFGYETNIGRSLIQKENLAQIFNFEFPKFETMKVEKTLVAKFVEADERESVHNAKTAKYTKASAQRYKEAAFQNREKIQKMSDEMRANMKAYQNDVVSSEEVAESRSFLRENISENVAHIEQGISERALQLNNDRKNIIKQVDLNRAKQIFARSEDNQFYKALDSMKVPRDIIDSSERELMDLSVPKHFVGVAGPKFESNAIKVLVGNNAMQNSLGHSSWNSPQFQDDSMNRPKPQDDLMNSNCNFDNINVLDNKGIYTNEDPMQDTYDTTKTIKSNKSRLSGSIFLQSALEICKVDDDITIGTGLVAKYDKKASSFISPLMVIMHKNGFGVDVSGMWIYNLAPFNIEIKIKTPFYFGISLVYDAIYGFSARSSFSYSGGYKLEKIKGYRFPLMLESGVTGGINF